jgi:hypothetical protein
MTTRCYDILEITDEYFLSACPQKRREMVIMGIHVHRNIPRHELRIPATSNSEIDELKQLHAQHIERKDHSIQLLNDEIVRLRSDIQTQLDNERTRIEERDVYVKQQFRRLNEENEFLLQQRQRDLKYHNEELERLRSRHEEAQCRRDQEFQDMFRIQNENGKTIQDQLSKLVDPRHKTTVELGKEGEENVASFLASQFEEGVLMDTTKMDGKGDFHFEYKGVRMLIEVKNIRTHISKKQDVDKFLKNVLDTKCDGGIIVNTQDGVRFPFRRDILDWDFHHNVPTLYVTNFQNTPHVLYAGMLAMFHYIKSKQELDRNHDKSAGEHKAKLHELVGFVQTWIPALEQTTKHAKNTLECLQTLNNNISTQLAKYDITFDNKTTYRKVKTTGKDGVLEAIGMFYNEHGREKLPKAKDLQSEFNIGPTDIQSFGGLKRLIKEFTENM